MTKDHPFDVFKSPSPHFYRDYRRQDEATPGEWPMAKKRLSARKSRSSIMGAARSSAARIQRIAVRAATTAATAAAEATVQAAMKSFARESNPRGRTTRTAGARHCFPVRFDLAVHTAAISYCGGFPLKLMTTKTVGRSFDTKAGPCAAERSTDVGAPRSRLQVGSST
jgi:hypothetical protein